MAIIQYSNKEITTKARETIFKLPTTFSWGGPKFDAQGLNLVISYILSDCELVNKRIYRRLCEYFDEAEVFYGDQNDPLLKRLCRIAVGALESRVDQGLTTRDRVILDMRNRQGIEFDPNQYTEISSKDIEWIESFATNIIDDLNTAKYLPQIATIKDQISAAPISERPEAIDRLYDMLNQMITKHNEVKSDKDAANSISFVDGDDFDRGIENFLKAKQNISEKLKVGTRVVNGMLGGGFERKRVYALMGIAGTGKSMTLLDFMLQVKNHNPYIIPKDKTKIPCIAMLTMENSVDETIERLLQMTEGPLDWKNATAEQIKAILKKNGVFSSNMLNAYAGQANYDVAIKIIYRAGESVNTSYLYELYDEMSQQGYELQVLFMDYVARIRSVSADNKDLIARYGAVINEFKVFANEKDIPVVTAVQINRIGAQLVNDRKSGHCQGNSRANLPYDLVSGIEIQHVGDSHKLIENIDVALAIVPEYEGNNTENRKWLGVKVCKSRNATSEVQMAFIPYDDYKKCKLVEDPIQGPVVTRLSMSSIYSENKGLDFNTNNKPAPKSAYSNEGMDACAKSAVAEKPKNEQTTFFNMGTKQPDEKAIEKSIASFFEETPKIDMEAIKMERQMIEENYRQAQRRYAEMQAYIAAPFTPAQPLIHPFQPQQTLVRPFEPINFAANTMPVQQTLVRPFMRPTW